MKYDLLPLTKIAVGKSKIKGRGVFALQDLEENEVIEEAHLIISGCPKDMQDKELARYAFTLFYNENLSPQENDRLNFQSIFKLMIDDEEVKSSLLSEIKDLGYEDISEIFSSATVLGFGMIYNHSKEPNVNVEIDYKDFLFRFTTNKKIKRGEELFISYGNNERKDLK